MTTNGGRAGIVSAHVAQFASNAAADHERPPEHRLVLLVERDLADLDRHVRLRRALVAEPERLAETVTDAARAARAET